MSPLLFYQDLIDGLSNVMTQDGGLFIADGLKLCEAFMVIAVIWWAIDHFRSSGFLEIPDLIRLIVVLTLAHTMLANYLTPIPGLGYSFVGIFTQMSAYLARTINTTAIDSVMQNLGVLAGKFEAPTWTQVSACIEYGIVMFMIDILGAVAFVVVSVGLVAQAALIIIGPIFVAFFLAPGLGHWFRGWFNSFVQYSFYRVFAALVLDVTAKVLAPEVARLPPIISVGEMLGWSIGLTVLLVGCVAWLLWVPVMASNCFSGASSSPQLIKV